MKEKLILEKRSHCPYCWADTTDVPLTFQKIPQGFFTRTEISLKCPNCLVELEIEEPVWTTEPSPKLWARRFNEV